jgi:hypothetical protein
MMHFNGPLRRPAVRYVDYIDVQDALAGSTAEQKEAAVRVCAGLLGIDEKKALKVDPNIVLPAFWTLLQYRGLNQSERGLAAARFSKLQQADPELSIIATRIMGDLRSNPELYPWSLTDLELNNFIWSNKTASTILTVLGFSPFAEAAVGNSFVKGLKQAYATKDAKDVLKTAAMDYAIPALVLKGYASALDAAASTESLEKVRRKERATAEKEAGDATNRAGAPPPNLIELGPPPIQKAW